MRDTDTHWPGWDTDRNIDQFHPQTSSWTGQSVSRDNKPGLDRDTAGTGTTRTTTITPTIKVSTSTLMETLTTPLDGYTSPDTDRPDSWALSPNSAPRLRK